MSTATAEPSPMGEIIARPQGVVGEIERGIEMPTTSRATTKGAKRAFHTKFPFGMMVVGDSFSYDAKSAQSVYTAAKKAVKAGAVDEGFKIKVRIDPTGEGNYRVWRVA